MMTIFHIMEKKGGPVLSDPLQAIKGTQSKGLSGFTSLIASDWFNSKLTEMLVIEL